MTHVLAQIAPGYSAIDPAAVWTDISQYVDIVTAGVSITRGASDEVSQIQPGTLSLVLDNSDGRFTPGLGSSPYYPSLRRGTPIRLQVATLDSPSGTAPYPIAQLADDFDDNRVNTTLWPGNFNGATETNGRARLPAVSGVTSGYASARQYTLTGSQTTAHLVTIPAATGTSATTTFMANAVTSGTRIGFLISSVSSNLSCRSDVAFADGSAVTIPYDATAHAWLRVREAAGTVYWETSADGMTWTVRRSAATPAWVGTDQVLLQMSATRNGGAADFAEFDLVGAQVHGRFYGRITGLPVGWKGLQSTVPVTAVDLFGWLSRQPALGSMLTQEVLLDSPQAYYPLTEPDSSTSAGDLSGTTKPALAIGQAGSGGTIAFAAAAGPAATGQQAPVFTPASSTAGKYLTADLGHPFGTLSISKPLMAECWFSTTTTDRAIWSLLDTENGDCQMTAALESGTGKVQITGTNPLSGTVVAVFSTPNLADGNLHHLVYDDQNDMVYVDGVSYGPVSVPFQFNVRQLTVGSTPTGTRLWSGTIAHLALYLTNTAGFAAGLAAHDAAGATGNAGETAAVRVTRLASYAGITTVTTTGTFSNVASQGQLGSTALSHMQDVERTESGKLMCDRGSAGLVFQSRSVRYNPVPALSLAYADAETDGVDFADDDQKLVNIITASRPGGATQRIPDAASIAAYGPYEQQLDLLKTSDNEVIDAANWMLNRYGDPPAEMRQLPVEAYSMGTAAYRTLLAADISTTVTVTALPDQAPAATTTVVVEGYEEHITHNQHTIDFRTSRADTDTAWTLDDPTYSVLGTSTRLAY